MELWEIEADINSLLTTGHWVDDEPPEWARKFAAQLGCHSGEPVVLMHGYREALRLLHEALDDCRFRSLPTPWDDSAGSG